MFLLLDEVRGLMLTEPASTAAKDETSNPSLR